MAQYLLPPLFVLFVWWFSTGAVLLVVGLPPRANAWRILCALALLGVSLAGVAMSSDDTSATGAYIAFTSAILLWGAQELAFLAGWVTGPRPSPCPTGCSPGERLSFALQAIIYHELFLLASGVAVLFLTWGASNPVAWWSFASLWALRQSAKINLFLGVRQHNDELLPAGVAFLKTYFAYRKSNGLFPTSIVMATGAALLLTLRATAPESTPGETAGLMLVATLVALGMLEHCFMMLPMSVVDLWRWSLPMSNSSTSDASIDAGERPDLGTSDPGRASMRQTLEDRFRQTFLQRGVQTDGASSRGSISAEPASATEGRVP